MNWTKEQKRVIENRNSDLLVSAAAGSGKTAVLSSRIVSLLTDPDRPTDIDRILVVTYTNAAAAEMRERIGKRIEEALEDDPLNQHLKKQTTLLHHAFITTIDSFCLYLLKTWGSRIGIVPGFTVADPGEMTLLSQEVLENVLEEAISQGDPEILSFISAYRNTRSTKPVMELIRMCAEFSESFPWPEEWLNRCEEEISSTSNLFSRPLCGALMDRKKKELLDLAGELSGALSLCLLPDGPGAYEDTLRLDIEELTAAARNTGGWEDFSRAIRECFSTNLKPLRKFEGDPLKASMVKGIRDEIKKELKKDTCFFSDPEELKKLEAASASHNRAILSLTRRYRELFSERKREKNVVDFSDMEHFALRLLTDRNGKRTEVAELLSDQFDEIMIDEYQDSNLVQETILSAIARKEQGKRNRFMVGDVKQSIYRFRQARPELFMEKYERFGEDGEERKIDLHKNFRSRKELLDAANHVFYRLMGEEVGGITYDSAAALAAGAEYPPLPEGERCFTLRLLEKTDEADEMLLLIDTIRSLMREKKVTDAEGRGFRKLCYSDITILLRSPGSVGEEMLQKLQDAGIPALLPRRSGFFSAQEIRVLLNLLRIIDNPQQDIPLASVMKSVIGGFSDEDLAEIRVDSKDSKIPFHRCVMASEKTVAFREELERYRELAAFLPVHELLQEILKSTGYLEKVASFPAGEKRCENVRMLVEKAVTFQKTSFHGLFRFIRYIESLEKYEEDFGEAELLNEETDAVRIMSIHKSKGLEFPVVILFGCGREMNRRDTSGRLLLSPEWGMGLLHVDPEKRTKQSTFTRDAIARLIRRDSLGEELRVLYVALTRAKEALVITGVKDKLSDYLEMNRIMEEGKRDQLLSSRKRMSAGSFLELLLPALAAYGEEYAPEIVTAEELNERAESDLAAETPEIQAVERETESAAEDFSYPFAGEEDVLNKISVTELKRRMAEEEGELLPAIRGKEEEAPIPSFARTEGSEATDYSLRGSAFHRAMECYEFEKLNELLALSKQERVPYLRSYYQKLTETGRLTEEYYNLLHFGQLLGFLESDTARRMEEAAKAGVLFKEKPFVLGVSAGKLYGNESKETVITQGIIDVYFTTGGRAEDSSGDESLKRLKAGAGSPLPSVGGRAVILDYKTDRVKTEEELKSKYKIQLELYEDAVRRITGCSETEKLLYSFTLQKTIEI